MKPFSWDIHDSFNDAPRPAPYGRKQAMEDDPDWSMEEARDRKDEEAADRRKGVAA